jgi:formylmethanofuran dehydrogenase subunit A
MNDADVVRRARRMGKLLREVENLCEEIRDFDHPNAEALYGELEANEVMVMAWPEHAVAWHLAHPERWETGDFGIRLRKPR